MYYEVASSPSVRNRIVEEKEMINIIKLYQKNGTEGYRSLYTYDEEILEHMKIRKTVKGYRGKYFLRDIIFDIDKGQNTEEWCLGAIRNFIQELIDDWKVPKSLIRIYFSSMKGYHIQIPDIFGFVPSNDMPTKVSVTMKKWFPIADNIYDHARIIRLPGTVNAKSGLFKIELSFDEIMKLDIIAIKELAIKPKWVIKTKEEKEEILEDMKDLPNYHDKIIDAIIPKTIDVNGKPEVSSENFLNCIQKIYTQGPIEGDRHKSIMAMVSSWRRSGIPKDAIITLMQKWASYLEPYEVKRLVEDVYAKEYRFGCKTPVMKKYCEDKCFFYKDRDANISPITAENLEKDFIKFSMSDFTMNSINLKDIYMLEEDFFVYPGELVILQGATGCNKSTLLQNWVIQFPTIETLYCNFEMGSNLTYRRFAQIAHSLSKWGIIDSTVNGNELSKAFNHLKSINQKFNIKELDRIISDWKPKLVLIDTIEDFIVEGAKDVTTVTHVVAPELKRLAMKYDIIIMTVQHLSKQGSATNDIHGGKGSSSIEQKADKVLRLSGDRTKQYRILESLKARDERPFKIFLEFDEQTFKLTQINVKG